MLKKPIVAAILCVIIVISSTVITTHLRLDPWCEEISEAFIADGGIADQLETVCTASSGIIRIAEAYGIDCFETKELCESLRVTTHLNSPQNLFWMYQMLNARISDLSGSLKMMELSAQESASLDSYSAEISAARSAISADGYNDSVSFFLRKELGSFSRGFARLCGVNLPEQFA